VLPVLTGSVFHYEQKQFSLIKYKSAMRFIPIRILNKEIIILRFANN
jgi:hypothetical protein